MTVPQRLATLSAAGALDPVPVDGAVAAAWATLRVALRDAGRRMEVINAWIAATAIAQKIPVGTQDSDYDRVPGRAVIMI